MNEIQGKIRLRQDSRDQHYPLSFGQTLPEEFPLELNFDSPIKDFVQPAGNVQCVPISVCDIATDEDKVVYDHDDLFNRVPSNQFGTDPRVVLSKATSQKEDGGLLLADSSEPRVKKFNSYWRADTSNTGLIDQFDTVRSTMLRANSSVLVATPWYWEWQGDIFPVGKNIGSYHAWVAEGWKQVGGEPMFIVEAWSGRKWLMPRETFNRAMKAQGSQSWVLSTSEVFEKVKISWMQKIVDLCVNTVLLLKQLLALKNKPDLNKEVIELTTMPPVLDHDVGPVVHPTLEEMIPKRDLLTEFCTAISLYEGKPGDLNHRNKNPGNIKGRDGKFLKFNTWDEGFTYLKKYVINVANNGHRAYPKDCTILEFFETYAPREDSNNPTKYAVWIVTKVGEPLFLGFKIKSLL